MKSALFAAVAVAAFVSTASGASAGVYADELSKCLVKSASTQDRAELVKWIFTVMSANPSVSGMTTVSPKVQEDLSRGAARLFQRLLLEDCRPEAVAAIKNEGPSALEGSFQVLGQTATRELMAHPAVMAELEKFAGYADARKWEALVVEAGLATAPAK